MTFLHWAVLEPTGPSKDLAAIRFSVPVRVQSICIFPTGAKPFEQQPDIVAETNPTAFYLNVYFNAQSVAPAAGGDGNAKPKPTTFPLVPTTIAYAGAQMEFAVEMSSEYSTRLMIIQGKFEKLSVALYGDILSEANDSSKEYTPITLPVLELSRIPASLDAVSHSSVLQIAQGLLKLTDGITDAVLIIRLMMSLKPLKDDWDDPEFPHLYANLQVDDNAWDLEDAIECISRPISNDVDSDGLAKYVEAIASSFRNTVDMDPYLLAKFLNHCAPQLPLISQILFESFDAKPFFTLKDSDESVLSLLVEATANPRVATHFNEDSFLDMLSSIEGGHGPRSPMRKAARRLQARIKGWPTIEAALSNTHGDFIAATEAILDMASAENSLGIFLVSMLTQKDYADKLTEGNTPGVSLTTSPRSYDEFMAFVRAFMAIASVVVVYAWSDAVPYEEARERALGILLLWQDVDGYRDIVERLMLLRQLTFRLECMLPIENEPPFQAGVDAEHIISRLAWNPRSYLHSSFLDLLNALKQPLNFISSADINAYHRLMIPAEDGLQSAFKYLAADLPDLLSREDVLKVRISVAIIHEGFSSESDEWDALEAAWDEGHNSPIDSLITALTKLRTPLLKRFSVTVPPRMSEAELSELFSASAEISILLSRLLPAAAVLPTRQTSTLTRAVSDILVCTDSADSSFSEISPVCASANAARQACIGLVKQLVTTIPSKPESHSISISTLGTLLDHAVVVVEGHDIVHHISQVFWLLDYALPHSLSEAAPSIPDPRAWFCAVATRLLPKFKTLYIMLDEGNKLHLIRRLSALDECDVGIGGWFLLHELSSVDENLVTVGSPFLDPEQRLLAHWRVHASLRVLLGLLQPSSSSSAWCIDAFCGETEASEKLAHCIDTALSQNIQYTEFADIAVALVPFASKFTQALRYFIFLVGLDSSENIETVIHITDHISEPVRDGQLLRRQVGSALSRLAEAGALAAPVALAFLKVLEFLVKHHVDYDAVSLPNISADGLDQVMQLLSQTLPDDRSKILGEVRGSLMTSEEPKMEPRKPPVYGNIQLPLAKWENLLQSRLAVPSTPPRRKSPLQTAEMLGLVTVSPPNALLRSPEVKGLTKTYSNNDFRQLRQSSAARQNTSRLPSMHVDDFEQSASPQSPVSIGHLPRTSFGSPPNPMLLDFMQSQQQMPPPYPQ